MKTLIKKLRIPITFVLSITGTWVLYRKAMYDGFTSLEQFVVDPSTCKMSLFEWLLWTSLVVAIGLIIIKLWEDKS
jgi:hypothetical protein